jgi:hypothetical protein
VYDTPLIVGETILAYSIDVDQKHNLVIVKFWGLLDASGFEEELTAVDSMGPFGEHYRALQIYHEHAQYTVSADLLREAARQRSVGKSPKQLPLHPKGKRVTVAPTDIIFGLNRLLAAELYGSGAEYTIVRTITEAASELGMQVADIDASFPV